MFQPIKSLFKRASLPSQYFSGVHELRKATVIAQWNEYRRLHDDLRARSPDSLALAGAKVCSQTDEDGIIEAIFERIEGGTFVEVGVETGVECNSLLLLLKGWRGVWLEGNPASCNKIESDLGARDFPGRFKLVETFVTAENVASLMRDAMRFLSVEEIALLSLDIDGVDLHVMRSLLESGVRPRALCVEYNAKFPPPIALSVPYDPSHIWDGSDFMGATLQAYVDMLELRGYRLVTCNLTGINAFFVRDDLADAFPRVAVAEAYQPFRPQLSPLPAGHPASLGFLRTALSSAHGTPAD